MICAVCTETQGKYKCPTCRISYCSLPCWKTHSSQKCEKYQEKAPLKESTLENYSYRTEDTVPIEKLKLLEQSEGVRETLHNPHVRSMLDIIDRSDNPVSALKSAMVEPIFVEFVEECLKVIEDSEEQS